LTTEGRDCLRERKPVALTKPRTVEPVQRSRRGEIACDEELFLLLRALRKRLADDRELPPYIIFSDVSLREMARQYPTMDAEFRRISGVGERKHAEFGPVFMEEIATFLRTHPRQIFAEDSFEMSSRSRSRSGRARPPRWRRGRS
jgi:ATP-dependent DNA helicase RecQ